MQLHAPFFYGLLLTYIILNYYFKIDFEGSGSGFFTHLPFLTLIGDDLRMLPPLLDTSQPLPLPMSIPLGIADNVVQYTTAYVS